MLDEIIFYLALKFIDETSVYSVNGQKKNYLSDWNQYGTLTSERKSLGLPFVWSLSSFLFTHVKLVGIVCKVHSGRNEHSSANKRCRFWIY
jgi:hypothetical protein